MSSDLIEKQFKQRLLAQGERLSATRLAVFRLLARKSPLLTTELVTLAADQAVDPATTYRTIKLYREIGIVKDIVAGGRRMIELSEDYDSHHHHFHCTQCERLIDFDNELIEASLAAAAEDMGVTITTHQLEITGLCADCQLLAHSAIV